ncbi:MAG: hypothetical protein KA105_05065 [Caulobacter sp.]|jgi:hypothetical protein|nr:hypothetical protein [Caulobacter sp.]
MRKFIVAAAVVASLAGGSVAFANEVAAPSAVSKPKSDKKDDPNRMVCTREHVVGSNRPTKVCMTVAERERMRDLATERLRSGKGSTDNSGGTPSGM